MFFHVLLYAKVNLELMGISFVPTVIGANGIEKILDFKLLDNEKEEPDKTLEAVKKTVLETGL